MQHSVGCNTCWCLAWVVYLVHCTRLRIMVPVQMDTEEREVGLLLSLMGEAFCCKHIVSRFRGTDGSAAALGFNYGLGRRLLLFLDQGWWGWPWTDRFACLGKDKMNMGWMDGTVVDQYLALFSPTYAKSSWVEVLAIALIEWSGSGCG